MGRVKVRIGVGVGEALAPEDLLEVSRDLEDLGFDSLWLPEVLTAPVVDPLVGLAWVGGQLGRLKLGTTMLLPGRHPVRLAKQIASLDVLCGGRLLVTFVPGLAYGSERHAVGIAPSLRGPMMDEAVPLLRRLWDGDTVSYHGALGDLKDVTVSPCPVQRPFDVWGGGLARSALERCGRLLDGWLPALCTPQEAAAGRKVVDRAADEAGRTVSEEHFGASVLYSRSQPSGEVPERLRARLRGRQLTELVPIGLSPLRALLEAFIAVGFSKFVVRPLSGPRRWRDELEDLAGALGSLQS